MSNPTDYSVGPWKLVKDGYELYLVHVPTGKCLFALDECQGVGPEAKKILDVIEAAPQVKADFKGVLDQIFVTTCNHHTLALKAAGTKEQVKLLADGLGAIMSLVQTALAKADT